LILAFKNKVEKEKKDQKEIRKKWKEKRKTKKK
jgi:hypothetical protein